MGPARDVLQELRPEGWQRPAALIDAFSWDAAVAGAGPAGALAALHLARRGHRVLLLDRAAFPRDKVCGDGLIADALGALGEIGLAGQVRSLGYRLTSASVFSPGGIEFRLPGEYVTLQRRILDALVARQAVRAGAAFCHGEVLSARIEPDGSARVQVGGCRRELSARVLVLATGSSVRLARQLGGLTRPPASAIGLRAYVRSRLALDRIVGVYHRSFVPGYGWIFPMRDGLFNVGVVVPAGRSRRRRIMNAREAFRRFTRDFPLARRLLSEGELTAPPRAAMLRRGLRSVRPLGPGHVVAVGEAAASTLPLTGEGVGKAMETGRLAARIIADALESGDMSRLDDYPRQIEQEWRPVYRRYAMAERWVARPHLNDLISWRVARSGFLAGRLAGLVRGTQDPRGVFSPAAVLQSLWR